MKSKMKIRGPYGAKALALVDPAGISGARATADVSRRIDPPIPAGVVRSHAAV